jgi:hypothetical protein
MKFWYQAAAGKLDPFVLVMEGSIPNEKIKKEGYWAALGTDSRTGQPITTNEWIEVLDTAMDDVFVEPRPNPDCERQPEWQCGARHRCVSRGRRGCDALSGSTNLRCASRLSVSE